MLCFRLSFCNIRAKFCLIIPHQVLRKSVAAFSAEWGFSRPLKTMTLAATTAKSPSISNLFPNTVVAGLLSWGTKGYIVPWQYTISNVRGLIQAGEEMCRDDPKGSHNNWKITHYLPWSKIILCILTWTLEQSLYVWATKLRSSATITFSLLAFL